MRNARAHKFQWSDPTVHSSALPQLSNKTLYIAGIEADIQTAGQRNFTERNTKV